MRYIIAAFAIIVVALLTVALIFGGNGKPAPKNAKITQLVEYADKNSEVSPTTIGKLVGEESRRAIRITVTPSERRLEVLSGYDESVLSTQTYPNTEEAYTNFLSALGGQGFNRAKKTSVTDSRSVCPTGQRFVYDLTQDGNLVSNLWASSCDKIGTFAGSGSTIRQLFQQQIPDYSNQVKTVKL